MDVNDFEKLTVTGVLPSNAPERGEERPERAKSTMFEVSKRLAEFFRIRGIDR